MRRSGWGGTWPKVAVVGLRATWQVGYTGVVTALMPKAREEEASRPTPQLPAGGANDGQGRQSLRRAEGPSEDSTPSAQLAGLMPIQASCIMGQRRVQTVGRSGWPVLVRHITKARD